MAAGVVTVFEKAQNNIGAGLIDLAGDNFALVLCNDDQALDANFTGGSGDCTYADLTDELANGVDGVAGYTAGGVDLDNATWAPSGDYQVFNADDVVFPTLTAVAKYAVIREKTTGFLVGFTDLDDAVPAGKTISGGDLNIAWNANGLFRLSQAF